MVFGSKAMGEVSHGEDVAKPDGWVDVCGVISLTSSLVGDGRFDFTFVELMMIDMFDCVCAL